MIQKISLILLGCISIIGLLAPWLVPNDPLYVDITKKLSAPSAAYPLGTDQLGRCIFSRLLMGIRYCLGTGVIIMGLSVSAALLISSVAVYKGGKIDSWFIRICDMLLAFPNVVLAFALVGMLGAGLKNIIIAITFAQTVYYARIFRSWLLTVKQQDYIAAAKLSGTKGFWLFKRHLWPNIKHTLWTFIALDMGKVLLEISSFSFIGLGVQAPTPEWGMMVNEGKQYIRQYPEMTLYPGLAIMSIVVLFYLSGNGMRRNIR